MRSSVIPLALVTGAMLAAACQNAEHATAPRSTIHKSALTDSETATLSGPWAQKIKGWGVFPILGTNAPSDTLQKLIYGMGITYVREQVDPLLYVSGTTYQNIVLNTTVLNEYVTKLQTAKSAHVDSGYIMSVWNPPNSMKNAAGDSLDPAKTGAFASYLAKVMNALSTSSVGVPAALSLQNEPDLNENGGVYYSKAQWDSTILKLRGELAFIGLGGIRIFGPETSNYSKDAYFFGGSGFPDLTYNGPGSVDSAVRAFATHSYGQCGIDTFAAGVKAEQQYRDSWQTEFSIINLNTAPQLDYALTSFSSLGADLVIAPNNYWTWWLGAAPDTNQAWADGEALISGSQTRPQISKRYWAFKKLWQYVRPGWSVKPFTFSSDPNLHINLGSQTPCANGGSAYVDLASFVDNGNDSILVMLVNHTTTTKAVTISGFPSTMAIQNSFRTDTSNDMIAQARDTVVGGKSTVSLPARSLVLAIMSNK